MRTRKRRLAARELRDLTAEQLREITYFGDLVTDTGKTIFRARPPSSSPRLRAKAEPMMRPERPKAES